jgi:hypothetical protein
MPSPGVLSRPPTRFFRAVVLSLLLAAASQLNARPEEPATWRAVQSRPAQPVAGPVVGPTIVTLDLAQCLLAAQQRSPRLAAHRASLATAEAGQRALEALHVPELLVPELPARRQQAVAGVSAAAARLDQAQREVQYAVTRSYFTVLYAREQERVTRGVVRSLDSARSVAQKALDAGAREVTTNDVSRATVVLGLAEAQRVRATQGVQRALAALREATGVGPWVSLDVPPGQLAVPDHMPRKASIVAWALTRRGELAQAGIFARVAALEIDAQASTARRRVETFAAGTDIHAQPVPPGRTDEKYVPGAVPPQYPTLLVGARCDRVQVAQSLAARAWAVVEVTSNLIVLEAEDAVVRFEEAAQQAAKARESADTGDKLAESLRQDQTSGAKVKVEDVVNAIVLAAQARGQYNEYLLNQAVALADLERVTGGAFCAGLADPALTSPRPEAKKDDGKGKEKDKSPFSEDLPAPKGKGDNRSPFAPDAPRRR